MHARHLDPVRLCGYSRVPVQQVRVVLALCYLLLGPEETVGIPESKPYL